MSNPVYLLFDTETTGNEAEDRIIQIGLMIFYGNSGFEYFDELCKSEVPIKIEAMSVHHITPQMIEDKPICIDTNAYKKIVELNSENNYLIAHNIDFDLGMLKKEGLEPKYKIIDTLRCARHLFDELPKHSLQYLRYALEIYKEEKMAADELGITIKAHDAISDVLVMKLFLSKLVKRVKEKFSNNNPMEKLVELSNTPVEVKTFKYGKYKGKNIKEVFQKDRGYIEWMLYKSQIDDKDLKWTLEQLLKMKN